MTRTDRVSKWRVAILFVVAAVIAMPSAAPAQTPKESKKRPDIYDKTADGEEQIAAALVEAKRDNKRVLLQFGANWCGWCHRLHDLFKKDRKVSKKLLYEYVVVLIDVEIIDGKPHNAQVNERFKNPTRHGLPVLVVLDAAGKPLTTKDTAELEEGDHHDPAKVLAFLEKWQPKPLSADEVLSDALARAKSDGKRVFVHFSAPWCGWCRRLDAYLHRPEIERVFGKAFIPLKIDVDRMTGGKAMDEKYRGAKRGGIPFFVILDPDGKKLADSNGPDGRNVGHPAEPHEIAHFMKVVRQTAPQLDEAGLRTLEKGLENPRK